MEGYCDHRQVRTPTMRHANRRPARPRLAAIYIRINEGEAATLREQQAELARWQDDGGR